MKPVIRFKLIEIQSAFCRKTAMFIGIPADFAAHIAIGGNNFAEQPAALHVKYNQFDILLFKGSEREDD